MSRIIFLIFSIVILALMAFQALGGPTPRVELKPVTKNIYVAVDGYFHPENSVVYVGEKNVTIISATWTPETAKLLVDEIRKITTKPITTVVDTHYHLDRTGGNEYFKKLGAKIISTKLTSNLMKEKWSKMIEGLRKDFKDFPKVPLVLPDVTFNDRYELEGGKIQLLYMGPAHTADGIVAYFPEEKVLDGDCIVKEELGYLGDANVEEYPKTLEKIKKLDIKTIIAGHWSPIHGGPTRIHR